LTGIAFSKRQIATLFTIYNNFGAELEKLHRVYRLSAPACSTIASYICITHICITHMFSFQSTHNNFELNFSEIQQALSPAVPLRLTYTLHPFFLDLIFVCTFFPNAPLSISACRASSSCMCVHIHLFFGLQHSFACRRPPVLIYILIYVNIYIYIIYMCNIPYRIHTHNAYYHIIYVCIYTYA